MESELGGPISDPADTMMRTDLRPTELGSPELAQLLGPEGPSVDERAGTRRGWIIAAVIAVAVVAVAATTATVMVRTTNTTAVPNPAPAGISASATSSVSATTGDQPASPGSTVSSALAAPGSVGELTVPAPAATPILSDAPELTTESVAAQPRTEIVKVALVDTAGDVLPGITVDDVDAGEAFGCDTPALSSVGTDIYRCGPTAASADICWGLPDRITLICGNDPWDTSARKLRADQTLIPMAAATDPRPWGVELSDGSKCRARNGGAWGGRADGLTGAYFCEGSSPFILGSDQPVIDKSSDLWTVQVGDLKDPNSVLPAPVTIEVVKAYFADTAPASTQVVTAAAGEAPPVDPTKYRAFAWSEGAQMTTQPSTNSVFFTSPSGNIRCAMYESVTCQIVVMDYPPPAEPAGCENFWATDHVRLGPDGAQSGFCTGGAEVPAESAVLPYGSSITSGGYVCASAETGITCTQPSTGRGFTLRRNAFLAF